MSNSQRELDFEGYGFDTGPKVIKTWGWFVLGPFSRGVILLANCLDQGGQ